MKNRQLFLPFAVLLSILAVGLFLRTRNQPLAAPAPILTPVEPTIVREGEMPLEENPGTPRIIDKHRYRLSLAEIRKRHEEVLMLPFPDYARRIGGGHDSERTRSATNIWSFTMPLEHIPDFQKYLLDLGVPEDALRKKVEVGFEAGNIPVPPAAKVRFLRTFPALGKGTAGSLPLDQESTVIYFFQNDNLQRTIKIYFSWDTGNTMITEG